MYVLSVTADQYNQKLGFLDSITFGGQILLIGMAAVFTVLCIIWGVLTLFKFAFTSKQNVKKNETPTTSAQPTANKVQKTDESEIVAVIAAAIAMAENESGNNVKFRVVSFKRI